MRIPCNISCEMDIALDIGIVVFVAQKLTQYCNFKCNNLPLDHDPVSCSAVHYANTMNDPMKRRPIEL